MQLYKKVLLGTIPIQPIWRNFKEKNINVSYDEIFEEKCLSYHKQNFLLIDYYEIWWDGKYKPYSVSGYSFFPVRFVV